MLLTVASAWLDSAFAGFDYGILEIYHQVATKADFIVGPIMEFLSIIGDNGYFSFALAFLLMLFKKTRKAGICVFFAIGFGALITNITLKELIARARPFQSGVEDFRLWWEFVGSSDVSEFSFPSGHVTAAMASMTALCLSFKPKWWIIAPAASYVVVMMAARNYLMVHYPTDVIAGVIVGSIGAVAAYFTIKGAYAILNKHQSNRLCSFVLNADICRLFKRKKAE